MAPAVISVSFSFPLSVTLTDAIFAPAAAAATAVTAAAPSPAIVAVTIRVPPYWVTVIIPLPWAIISLTFISSSLNLRSWKNFCEYKTSTPKCKTDTHAIPDISAVARAWLRTVIHSPGKLLLTFVLTIWLGRHNIQAMNRWRFSQPPVIKTIPYFLK